MGDALLESLPGGGLSGSGVGSGWLLTSSRPSGVPLPRYLLRMETMHDRALPDAKQRSGIPWWGWLLIVLLGLVLLIGGTCVGGVLYLGTVSPETSVYTANRVPQRFTDELADAGALDPDEQLRFLYSDGITGISEGSYLLTDRGVTIYGEGFAPAVQRYPFEEIAGVSLSRDTSFWIDSDVTLELIDGSTVSFPLSSEHDRDEAFVAAIRAGLAAELSEPARSPTGAGAGPR